VRNIVRGWHSSYLKICVRRYNALLLSVFRSAASASLTHAAIWYEWGMRVSGYRRRAGREGINIGEVLVGFVRQYV
jgi:hypothetical protein